MQIFVGNLPSDATEGDVRALFEKHGRIQSVVLGTDHATGKPAGYAIVVMPVKSEARTAVEEVKASEYQGRKLAVKILRPGDEFHDHILNMTPGRAGATPSLKRFRGDGSYRGSGAIRRGGRRGG